MSEDNEQYKPGLEADLTHIYENGLEKEVESVTIPVLAELAEAVSGNEDHSELDHYSDVVECVLRQAIQRLERTAKWRSGVEALFGMTSDRALGLEARRNDAANALGYKDADTLRRGQVNKRPLHVVILEEVTYQLVALAIEHDFLYSARYGELVTSSDEPPAELIPPTSTTNPVDPPAKHRLRPSRRILFVIGMAALAGAAVFAGASILTAQDKPSTRIEIWGPSRQLYDYSRSNGNNDCADPTNPAAYYGRCGAITEFPVFNSFINTPTYGDERAFFDGRRGDQTVAQNTDPITNVTSSDKIATLRLYVDNMAVVHPKEPELTTAYNARVRVALPSNAGSNLVVYGYISADRTTPVYDTVDLIDRHSFELEYLPGSAVLLRGNHRYPLSDSIIGSEGALIGTNVMNGVLPPSETFSTTALIELKVRAVSQPPSS
jgi:hypothetical protein